MQTFLTLTLPRFPMMRPSQLADLLLSPLTTDYMPFMMGRMQAAMGYHRFCLELWLLLIQKKIILLLNSRNTPESVSNLLKYKNGDRLLTARLYTEDKFCCRFHQ